MATLIDTVTDEAVTSAPIRTAYDAASRPANYSRTEFLDAPSTLRAPAASLPLPQQVQRPALPGIDYKVRRSISPVSGKALEKLGHAIEYLMDEFAFESAVIDSGFSIDPAMQAIQLLKSANRQIYFECPVVQPLAQRIFSRLFPRQSVPGRA